PTRTETGATPSSPPMRTNRSCCSNAWTTSRVYIWTSKPTISTPRSCASKRWARRAWRSSSAGGSCRRPPGIGSASCASNRGRPSRATNRSARRFEHVHRRLCGGHRGLWIGEAGFRGKHVLLRVEHFERERLVVAAEHDGLHLRLVGMRRFRRGLAGDDPVAQRTQAYRLAQSREERTCELAGAVRAGQQGVFDLARFGDQGLVAFAHRRQFAVEALE